VVFVVRHGDEASARQPDEPKRAAEHCTGKRRRLTVRVSHAHRSAIRAKSARRAARAGAVVAPRCIHESRIGELRVPIQFIATFHKDTGNPRR